VPLIRRSRDEHVEKPEDETQSELARRVLAHAGTPEEKLERLLAERSRELEEQAASFEKAMEDLERREDLLRDMRASVERMLRLGATDLTDREAEIRALSRDVEERTAKLKAEEAELTRRRSELGAVELKREAVERRERAVAAREERLGSTPGAPPASDEPATVSLLFVPGPAYRLVEVEPTTLAPGETVEVEGTGYVVARLGPAPFAGDRRRCAYLERGVSGSSGSEGSS
jgi:hypothetical protein